MRLVVAVLLLTCMEAYAGTPLPNGPHVVVKGEAKVSAEPDSVRIRFDFEQHAPLPLPAKHAVDEAVNRLLAKTAAYGIDEADVTASDLDTSEDVTHTDDGKRVSNGFVADRSVTVLLKHVDRLDALLDDALAAGARSIGEVFFQSTEAAALRERARREAIDEAKAKAANMAGAFDASLGPVYSIDSIHSQFAGGYGATELDRVEVTGTRGSSGRYLRPTVEYSETVNAVFELKR